MSPLPRQWLRFALVQADLQQPNQRNFPCPANFQPALGQGYSNGSFGLGIGQRLQLPLHRLGIRIFLNCSRRRSSRAMRARLGIGEVLLTTGIRLVQRSVLFGVMTGDVTPGQFDGERFPAQAS